MRDARESAGIVALAGGVGVAFCVFLLSFAWQNSLETARRQFAFESVSIAGALRQNVSAADEISGYLASLLVDERNETPDAFTALANATLGQHQWLQGVGYQAFVRNEGELPVLDAGGLLISANAPREPSAFDLRSLLNRPEIVDTVLFAAGAVPTGVLAEGPFSGSYLLARVVRSIGNAGVRGEALGLIVMIIDPSRLLGPSALRQSLGVTLISESEGVVGRQFLYSGSDRAGTEGRGWIITRLTENTSVQMPSYSFRLLVSKPVYWRSIEHGLLVTALVLGAGIALLLIALARSREAQAYALRERNAEIERQVLRQTRELAIARDVALGASRVKSDFLASMSHEIRTPLNAIIGMSELLGETPLNDEQARYVGVFRKAGEALLSLVNDILDLSKIEAGQLTLEQIEFELRDLVEHSLDIYALKAGEKGLSLCSRVSLNLPGRVIGDPTRLRQVLLNLIGNATKFTEHGGIAVRVDPAGAASAGVRIRVTVEDTGIGIPADKRSAIFSSFTQVDSSTTRKYGGTGLGLTICRHLVEMMGGHIDVDSEVGRGSRFHFEVELGVVEQATPHRLLLPQPVSVLLVSSDSLEAGVLTEVAIEVGARVTLATDAAAARQWLTRESFTHVLCDRVVAGDDGVTIATALRTAVAGLRAVVMMSPSSPRADFERATAAGIGTLVKPIKLHELFLALTGASAAAANGGQVESTVSQASTSVVRRRILLVEDTPDNVLLIRAFLKSEPLDLDVAENGAVGLERFGQGRYDLVLMDMQMPVMDGYAATGAIRELEQREGRSRTTVIALTAHAIREDIDRCLAAGCDAHLAKPIKKAVLLQTLNEALAAH
jgi:signal transduction histidine kinase/DNA-binding response OmpR family regulator